MMVKQAKINAHNFSHIGSNSIKITFLDSSYQNRSIVPLMYNLLAFEVRILQLFLVMTSFLITGFPN